MLCRASSAQAPSRRMAAATRSNDSQTGRTRPEKHETLALERGSPRSQRRE